jgi:hypothetical protein
MAWRAISAGIEWHPSRGKQHLRDPHWWCAGQKAVILRPYLPTAAVNVRHTHFILKTKMVQTQFDRIRGMTLDETKPPPQVVAGLKSATECLQIESHLQGEPWTELLTKAGC